MNNLVLKSFYLGIKRRWRSAFTKAFGAIGIIWTLTEVVMRVSKDADQWVTQNSSLYSIAVTTISVGCFIYSIYEVRKVSFFIPTTDPRITIKFGDLFAQKTDLIIGVNEFFDGKIGHFVAQESLHGKFISKVYNGDEAKFRYDVDLALANVSSVQTQRSTEPSLKYNIGTTAILKNGAEKAYLVAVSNTNLTTAKASSTVAHLWKALNCALQSVQDYGNGAPVSIPLIGNGRSSVNLEPQHLLRLVTLALVDFGRKHGIPKEIYIIAHEGCFEMLDIREIKRDWSKK